MSEQVEEPGAGANRPVDRVVLALSAGGVLAVVLWGVLARGSLAVAGREGLAWVISTFGWSSSWRPTPSWCSRW